MRDMPTPRLPAPFPVAAAAVALSLLGACTGELSGTPQNVQNVGPDAGPTGEDVAPELRDADTVCRRWRLDRELATTTTAVGVDVNSCEPGEMPEEGLTDAVRYLNLHRWLTGLNPVGLDDSPEMLAGQQECALIQLAMGGLSHRPPPSAPCYTERGARHAASNLSYAFGSTAADSVDQFMQDRGDNNGAVGHRRHFFNDTLDTVGVGAATDGRRTTSCIWVFDTDGEPSGRPFAAYPNPGIAPIALVGRRCADGWCGDPEVRWSLQNAGLRTEDLSVEIERLSDGAVLSAVGDPVNRPDPSQPPGPDNMSYFPRDAGNYGGSSAIVWIPDGWTPEVGERYRITVVRPLSGDISWETEFVDCGA